MKMIANFKSNCQLKPIYCPTTSFSQHWCTGVRKNSYSILLFLIGSFVNLFLNYLLGKNVGLEAIA